MPVSFYSQPATEAVRMSKKSVLVIGAGDATGGAIARRFAREGYAAVIVRRDAENLTALADQIRAEGGEAHPFGVDARLEEPMVALFERIEADIAPLEAVVFNIGANVNFGIRDTTARVYRKVWEMAAFAGFLTGREAAKHMVPRGRGTILFTGATASLRGGKGFSAFAGAKFALRGLAQSMARELGPQGIHVAHAIIDGAIDTAWIAENFPQRHALKDQDGILDPDHIADAYWMLHSQPRDAWTHELDLRPWMETF
jgi:NAD(P)-dependent dehydrogenase (short-subunit alcohol dehydrogenase family)